ncbi:hypothetical protein BGZ95_001504 [Linnemannia exigua]|uniref:Uncharacterized protein n=1 Tax=Linnemannia exigua TaxID=604196 RepID=A0AAD4D774_9FUNG|nr:hypothetical protein BGZ95_001504 [Linnemannia exigua]
MHLLCSTPRIKTPRPPSPKVLSSPSQDMTPCVLAIAIVNSTPPGTCVLERLAQIIRDREQQQHQQQQEQQRSSDATNLLQSTTTSSSTAVDQENQGENEGEYITTLTVQA